MNNQKQYKFEAMGIRVSPFHSITSINQERRRDVDMMVEVSEH